MCLCLGIFHPSFRFFINVIVSLFNLNSDKHVNQNIFETYLEFSSVIDSFNFIGVIVR